MVTSASGIDAADEQQHVVESGVEHQRVDAADERHVGAGEDADPDHVAVLLERGGDDLLGRPAQTRVDHLHARRP